MRIDISNVNGLLSDGLYMLDTICNAMSRSGLIVVKVFFVVGFSPLFIVVVYVELGLVVERQLSLCLMISMARDLLNVFLGPAIAIQLDLDLLTTDASSYMLLETKSNLKV